MKLFKDIFNKAWFVWMLFSLGCLLTITMIGGVLGIPILVILFLNIRNQVKAYELIMTPEIKDVQNLMEINDKLVKEIMIKENMKTQLEIQITNFDTIITNKKNELIIIDESILMQEFGVYEPQFDFANSTLYKIELDSIREQQKNMIKNKNAIFGATNWQVNGKTSEGKKMVNQMTKILLRAFNNECDTTVSKVKFNNFDVSIKRIEKSYEQINKNGVTMNIRISPDYLILKIKELHLAYEYAQKKEIEKELLREQRAELKEQQKFELELQIEREKLDKESKHYSIALKSYEDQFLKASDDQKVEIQKKIDEILDKMMELKKISENLDYREQNNKAGYVYIISNIGAFGENVFKIGVTRRLEPLDRVKELGDASVPFEFDVHAMIFTDDAFKLEKTLHNTFNDKRVNKVNNRREFFNVKLDEIESIVKEHHNNVVEFSKIALAEQYRISRKIHK